MKERQNTPPLFYGTTLSVADQSANGRKTRDRISQVDWDVLKSHLDMFHNPIPPFYVPSYSIHVDRCAHIHFHDAAIFRQLILAASLDPTSPGTPTHQ